MHCTKGGSISESVSLWLKSAKNHSPEHLQFRWIAIRGVMWHFFLRFLSISERLSEFNSTFNRELASGILNNNFGWNLCKATRRKERTDEKGVVWLQHPSFRPPCSTHNSLFRPFLSKVDAKRLACSSMYVVA